MRLLAALIALSMLAVAVGCGGEGDPPEGKTITAKVFKELQEGVPAQVGQGMVDIGVYPGDDPAFTVAKVIGPPGNTNFRLRNPQDVGHNLTIREVGAGAARTPVIREGSAWLRVSLRVGHRYIFYCSVPGHREEGMEGKIEMDRQLNRWKLEAFQS